MACEPAQPITSCPCSSLSRFSRILPVIIPGSRPLAPISPCSSSTVRRTSIGPCTRSLSSNTAIPAAHAIPLSAPRVVPLARTQSPSTIVWIGSFKKSNSTSLFFSATISWCPCNTIVGAFSCPGVAGLVITTFPTASVLTGILCFSAQPTRNAFILSRWCVGRGTRVISSKHCQSSVGFKSVIFMCFCDYFLRFGLFRSACFILFIFCICTRHTGVIATRSIICAIIFTGKRPPVLTAQIF